MRGKAITQVKGHEPKLYEALVVFACIFFKFTIVKMKGPNKTIKPLNCMNETHSIDARCILSFNHYEQLMVMVQKTHKVKEGMPAL